MWWSPRDHYFLYLASASDETINLLSALKTRAMRYKIIKTPLKGS